VHADGLNLDDPDRMTFEPCLYIADRGVGAAGSRAVPGQQVHQQLTLQPADVQRDGVPRDDSTSLSTSHPDVVPFQPSDESGRR